MKTGSKRRLIDFMGTPPTRALSGLHVAGYFNARAVAPSNIVERGATIAASRAYSVLKGA